jgi:hypothetical protein
MQAMQAAVVVGMIALLLLLRRLPMRALKGTTARLLRLRLVVVVG